jgi:VanZ family protein
MLNYKYLSLALFSTLLIIYASSIPDQALLGDDSLIEQIISNLAHIPAYALLTFLWLKAFERRKFVGYFSRVNTLILIGLILFAVSDEIHQSFIPGRFASYMDIGLDFLGIFFGLVTFKIFGLINVSQEG